MYEVALPAVPQANETKRPLRDAARPGAPADWIPGPGGAWFPVYMPGERELLDAVAEDVQTRRGTVVGALEAVGADGIRGYAYDWRDPSRAIELQVFVDGVQVDFDVEVYRIDRDDGCMWVRVEARSSLDTPLRLRPAFEFRKLPDGRAFTSST